MGLNIRGTLLHPFQRPGSCCSSSLQVDGRAECLGPPRIRQRLSTSAGTVCCWTSWPNMIPTTYYQNVLPWLAAANFENRLKRQTETFASHLLYDRYHSNCQTFYNYSLCFFASSHIHLPHHHLLWSSQEMRECRSPLWLWQQYLRKVKQSQFKHQLSQYIIRFISNTHESSVRCHDIKRFWRFLCHTSICVSYLENSKKPLVSPAISTMFPRFSNDFGAPLVFATTPHCPSNFREVPFSISSELMALTPL